jgi:hypothetical protein
MVAKLRKSLFPDTTGWVTEVVKYPFKHGDFTTDKPLGPDGCTETCFSRSVPIGQDPFPPRVWKVIDFATAGTWTLPHLKAFLVKNCGVTVKDVPDLSILDIYAMTELYLREHKAASPEKAPASKSDDGIAGRFILAHGAFEIAQNALQDEGLEKPTKDEIYDWMKANPARLGKYDLPTKDVFERYLREYKRTLKGRKSA